MEFGKLGTIAKEEGGFDYAHERNPLLRQGIYGFNFGLWRPSYMNPVTFATLEAATAIARVLGGFVVPDPNATNWNLRQGPGIWAPVFPVYNVHGIMLPNGMIVNAGAICGVLGNDVAFNSAAGKSQAICAEILFSPTDPNLADRLFEAIRPLI